MYMRSRRWRVTVVAVLVTFLGTWGCGAEPAGPEVAEPTFVGTWAGDRWEGEASLSYGLTDDTLYIHGASPVGAGSNAESIVDIRVVYAGTGTYALGPGDGTFTRLLGGDGVVGRYGTATEAAGILTVVEHAGDRIVGVAYFEARDVLGPSPDPSLIRFEGSFEARIPD
jgi:hypothetical protein